ncbi:ATP-dependent zinc metalloprotease FTSH, chloroplastic-like protein [Tanacetum coccineum]
MDACGKMESEKVLNKIEPLFYVLQHVKESMRKIGINGLHTEIGATRGMERILDTIKKNHMASYQPLAGKFVKDRGKKNGSKSDVIEVNEKEAVKASQKAERAKNDSMSSKQEAQESSSISGSSTYKSKAPGVVYIDEFDSVERQRGASLGCGNEVTEQTLHHFLLKIDRLSGNTEVCVGDTTNRPDDVIGLSLLRPRRFSKYLSVELAMWNWRKRKKPSGRNCKFKQRKLNFDDWKWPLVSYYDGWRWPLRKKEGRKNVGGHMDQVGSIMWVFRSVWVRASSTSYNLKMAGIGDKRMLYDVILCLIREVKDLFKGSGMLCDKWERVMGYARDPSKQYDRRLQRGNEFTTDYMNEMNYRDGYL